ncbi:MAG: UvrD/REP helicase [Firmicutes bacterium]|nr:UvrD/REP helicase [Bacillota bacterium]
MESIYTRLRSWRGARARELNVPSFFILSNAYLAGVAAARPTSMAELAACPGLGPKKLAQFGPELLTVLLQCLAEGLEPGVLLPSPQPEEPAALSEEALVEIASALRQETAKLLARRFKGRFTAAQLEEALRRLAVSA